VSETTSTQIALRDSKSKSFTGAPPFDAGAVDTP